jgi:hypothetical protein
VRSVSVKGQLNLAGRSGAFVSGLLDVELMPQHQDFGFKPSSRLETAAQNADEMEGNGGYIQALLFDVPASIEPLDVSPQVVDLRLALEAGKIILVPRTKARGYFTYSLKFSSFQIIPDFLFASEYL